MNPSESSLFLSGSLSSSTGSGAWLLVPLALVGASAVIIVISWSVLFSPVGGQLTQAGGNAEVILVRSSGLPLKRSPTDEERGERPILVNLEKCSVDRCEAAPSPELTRLVWPEGKLTELSRLPQFRARGGRQGSLAHTPEVS